MKTFKSLRNLAMFGALFAATHGLANGSHEVVSEKGVTSIVERIDFPGQIKDVIPAGDKYIIHADPIASLKDSVAVDALFVMEKDKTGTAFGRTFSEPIHSVAYVPGLDIAVWSYDAGNNVYNTNLFEMVQGQPALKAAGSNKVFTTSNKTRRISPNSELLPSASNTVWEVGSTSSKQHVFAKDNIQYTEDIFGGTASSDERPLSDGMVAGNEESVFVLRSAEDPVEIVHHKFDGATDSYDIPNMGKPTSMATISMDGMHHEGKVFLGYESGTVRSSGYTAETLGGFNNPQTIINGAVDSMAATTNQTLHAVSKASNEMVEVDKNGTIVDKVVPNPSETGYRKVITDKGDTLLLSNTQSNCFYRIKTR